MHPRRLRLLAVLLLIPVVMTACGTGSGREPPSPDVADWDAVLQDARGGTVRWWMFGGDARVNRYVDQHVVPAADELGIAVERVPVADTADAVQRVLAEQRAGTDPGGVDLIWINGENFVLGREAGLWLEDWAGQLPNATLVDWDTVDTDFGVPIDGQESPWSRAVFLFAHDRERMPEPPRSFEELLDWARAHPGRITYPAPPDFTGSAFVRQVVQAMGEDAAFAYLRKLQPHLWRGGRTHPADEAELNSLFGNGEVDLAMSYDPAFVRTAVEQGTFPPTARPFTLDRGALHNVSYVTIPRNAPHPSAALVVANLLLEPDLQALKADPEVLGVPTVLDLDRLDPEQRTRFERRTDSPHVLTRPGPLLDELPADRVEPLEQRWRRQVLR